MLKTPHTRLAAILALAYPAINPRSRAYEPYIEKLDFYRRFLTLIGYGDRFDEIASGLYEAMMEGYRIKEKEYRRVVEALEWEVEKGITEIIMAMQDAGSAQKAEFLDKYLADRDFGVLYRILRGILQEEWDTIELYRKILAFFNETKTFNSIAGEVYSKLKSRVLVNEQIYAKVEEQLREVIDRRIRDRIENLRRSGYGREADKVEEFLKGGDYENAYYTLKGIKMVKKVDVEEVDLKEFMKTYLESYRIIELLSRAGVDVEDIKWKVGEIMKIGSLKIPDDRVIIVDDPYGNAACYLSLYLKRLGVPFTFFSTSGIGDFWITQIDVDNRISPTLQASKLGEKILSSEGLILLEDINYLILSNKFSEVYRFLYYIKNNFEGRIIMTINLKMLNERERARLQGIADSIIQVEFPVNICASNLIAVENRLKEGALLLSKERVDDFPGKVYIISDFGGEYTLHPQRIDFEIMDKIAEFIDSGSVVIDALDMLIDENGLEKIYLWLKSVRDIAKKRGKRVYVVTRDLVASERNYIMPLVDFDTFLMANIDKKRLAFMQREMKTVKRILEKKVEKECVYTLEIIKHRFEKYRKYLSDFEEDISKLGRVGTYDINCIIKIAPIKREIERRVEEIENITVEFRERMEKLDSLMPVLRVYVDTGSLDKCMIEARKTIESGNYMEAIDKLEKCEDMAEKLQRRALSRAWSKREEIMCVSYLLPPHLREKVIEFEGEREKLKDFTILYMAVRNLLARKMLKEHEKLKKYAEIASMKIFGVRDFIREERYCDYKKAKEKFLRDFEDKKEEILEQIRSRIMRAIEFLKSRGYDVSGIEFNEENEDLDALLDIAGRVEHHLVRYVENYFNTLRDRCPRCIGTREIDFLEKFRRDPLNTIEELEDTLTSLEQRSEKEMRMLKELTREIEGHYALLKKYGVETTYIKPTTVAEAKMILNDMRSKVEGLTPDLDIQFKEWVVDDTRAVHAYVEIINRDRYPAKNVSIETHGAFSHNSKIEELSPGESRILEIIEEVRDPDSMVDVDVVYEGPGGNIATKSFQYKLNLRGYFVKMASGNEKCSICRGRIFKDNEMAICAKCGATYHIQCAKRYGKCKICGNVFIT